MPAPSTPVAVRPAAAELSLSSRIADYAVIVLSVVLGCGSIALFAWAGRPVLVPMGLSPREAVTWNALLSCVFFAQHSIMVRRPIRARLSVVIPVRYEGAFYAITSGVALAFVAVLLQPAGAPLFVLYGPWRAAVDAAALAAVAGFVWSAAVLDSFDPLGLRPIREHLRGSAETRPRVPFRAKSFVVRGPYQFVRHPLYSFIIVLLWADPQMSASRFTLAALWSAWISVGAWLEERDLTAEFGNTYERYRRQVPMLFPWRGRVRVRIDQAGRRPFRA